MLSGVSGKTDENYAGGICRVRVNKLSKILVFSQENAVLTDCKIDDHLIGHTRRQLAHGCDIMACLANARTTAKSQLSSARKRTDYPRAVFAGGSIMIVSSWARVSAA